VKRRTKNNAAPDDSRKNEDRLPARAIAIEALSRFDPKRNYAGPILEKLLHKTDEKQRATDLVFGTIRNRAAIDTVIEKLSRCPVERIPAKLLNIIRVGAYELIYAPATGEYAIVDEAAENAKAAADKKQVGFVNAVLRQIARLTVNRQSPLTAANVTRALPQSPTTGCEFAISFLPNPQTQPADYLSAAFSLPNWLIADWLTQFGFAKVWQICLASNRRPSIYLRPNTLKTTTQKLAEKLRQANIDVEAVSDRPLIRIKSPREITQLPDFARGEFTIQDLATFEPVRVLNPQPGWTILDLCAAPGVKTTQLAEATGDKAQIIATDADANRLEKLKENAERLGIRSITIVPFDELFTSKFEIRNSKFKICLFDAILLDVPCSNTGVLARRIEARYRLKPDGIKQLAKTQGDLLNAAAKLLKPHGKICYSTCSIQKEENSDLVKNFLQQNPDFSFESEELILPSAPLETFSHGSLTGSVESRTNCPSSKEQDPNNQEHPHQASIGAGDHDGGYVAIIRK
jgi:16S rRNA (cytosine967-C5)-methyltransferase